MATSPPASQNLTSNNIEARDVNVGSTVNNTFNNQTFPSQRDPMQLLQDHVAIGALYNSDERFDPPKCHPQTRTAVLNRVKQWAANESDDAKPILWLRGPAGAGKSAIAQTLVETWKENGVLFVAFFFWRTASERNQKTRLVPTIALQLMELFPSIRSMIEAAIDTIGLFKRNLSYQLDKLVVEPLCSISQRRRHVVIVIDGLDECCTNLPSQDYESQQREILEALAAVCPKLPWVRFLIVSRPERQIRESFGKGRLQTRTISLDLKDASDANEDVRLYLNCKFGEIRQQHRIRASWPTEAQLEELVRKSSGQFIYPSVAMKYITRPRANPIQSLDDVLDLQPGSVDNPLAELDMLYTLVLRSVSTQSVAVVTDILWYILADVSRNTLRDVCKIFAQPPIQYSPQMFERFLFLSEGGVNFHLTDLHSVMDIPTNPHHVIRFIHATFPEYVQNQSRSGDFFISKKQISVRFAQLSIRHLQVMDSQTTSIGDYVASTLFLCTCYWIDLCPPLKELALYSWSLMRTEIGAYPSSISHIAINFLPLASKELSTQFVSAMNGDRFVWRRGLIEYLQRCNIPEIEPSWWRRLLVRWRLNDALSRIRKERRRL